MFNKVRRELDRMKQAGVIKKGTQPTEWVSTMHIMHKPNGKLRICMDPRNLNEAILHEHVKR